MGCMPRFRRAGAFGFASCSHRFFLGFFLTWVFSSAFSSQIANAPGLGHTQSPPRRDGRARAPPENHQIRFFRLRLLNYLSGCDAFGALHATFLSERPVHSGLSLISPGQPLTLPRATVHSRLLGQYALSTVE